VNSVFLDELSGAELRARLRQRGVSEIAVEVLVRNRERIGARREILRILNRSAA
jgi:hypothetical protein